MAAGLKFYTYEKVFCFNIGGGSAGVNVNAGGCCQKEQMDSEGCPSG